MSMRQVIVLVKLYVTTLNNFLSDLLSSETKGGMFSEANEHCLWQLASPGMKAEAKEFRVPDFRNSCTG